MTHFIESPQFGVDGGWRLLYRVVDDDGVSRETRVLPVRGLGALMQTTMRRGDVMTLSNTATINGVVLIEYLRPVAADAVRVLHRELVTVAEFEKKQKKNAPKFPAGSVISFNVGVENEEEQQQQQDQDQDPGEVESQQPDGQPGP